MAKVWKTMVLALFLSCASLSWAAFDDLGAGARPLGMGGAFVATADDSNALRYNAAGMGIIQQPGLSFTQNRPFAGLVVENHLAGVLPLAGVGTIGVSASQLTEDNDVYTESIFTLGFARRWTSVISAGLQLKYLSNSLDETNLSVQDNPYFGDTTSASAVSMDLGVLLSGMGGLQIGAAVGNLVPADIGMVEEDTLPVQARFGVAYEFTEIAESAQQPALQEVLKATRVGVQLSLTDEGRGIHVGAESWLSEGVAIRAGYVARTGVHSAGQLGIGASVKLIEQLQIDYAFQWFTEDLSDNTGHRISTSLIF